MDDSDGLRVKLHHEDSLLLVPSLAEPINLEDYHYAQLQNELDYDAQNLQAEIWSVAVDQNYVKALNKEAVNRQDVIYELMQTEMHHVRNLKILLHVFMHELRKSQLMDEAKLEWLFPGLEDLLRFHQDFFTCLKEQQSQYQEEGSSNYQISNLGDILISQFSDTQGDSVMKYYSLFCSRHIEAINFYKEQLQNSKKFQFVIRKIGQLPLVRRLGIPEYFLLVTQRITKYPVLIERIIQNTKAETDEYQSLVQGLALIKDIIFKVNAQVSEYEKVVRLSQRLEPKSQGRMKDGHLFRREDLFQRNRFVLHECTVTWKSSGRQKDIHAVLLSDVLLLLQEKDQKLVFATMDNKPPVISLQRLIVREMAHEEKGLFLICDCTSGKPEMYEIHTSSAEECVKWMGTIRRAVDSCRENEEYSVLIGTLQKYQDILKERDDQIKQSLTEKQQIFAALYEITSEQETPHKGLLLQQKEILPRAIREVDNLQNLLFLRIKDPNMERAETFAVPVSDFYANTMKNGDVDEKTDSSGGSPVYMGYTDEHHQLQDVDYSESLEQSADDDIFPVPDYSSTSTHFPEPEVCDSVIKLAQYLYSLQAVAAEQESQTELQRVFQSKIQQPTGHYSSVLLEQEKQRNLEKQREELGNLHKLQAQHREEQQRWEKEREQQRMQIETLEAQLKLREETCNKWEEKLNEEKAELERQKEEHQRSLERLRESIKSVEKEKERQTQEKERLEQTQEKIKKYMNMIQSHSNYDDPTQFPNLPSYHSFRGSIVNGGGSLTLPLKPQVKSNIISNPMEIPPKVPPRKESISPQPAKSELPVHLISTTNQVHTPSAVQQRIPTKLAAPPRGKEKGMKTKKSHQRTNSAASIDVNQVVPIRVTGKEGGSLRSTKHTSPPRIYQSDIFKPPGSTQNMQTSQSFNTHKRNSINDDIPPVPPPFPKDVLKKEGEKVVFL
ncbi:rho guanine nucleotide exchange factor 18a [Anabas testudineus]|uniref:Rho/rac guanine nucleotide exchange factor (GEF) 18a n=1 Tax=Anabas testudineus TaxID=64144 RepID=A0A3Q1KC14_ANATE|nr:rho guanine nucleotide exchange factor 18a [Anabas testudineus]